MNGTLFSASGLILQNRGLYPITFALSSDILVNGSSLGSSSIGPLTIPPGGEGTIDLNLTQQISQLLTETSLISKLLFNGTSASLRLNVTGGFQPFVTATASETMNTTIGPVLDGFNLKAGVPTPYNQTHVVLPVDVSFTNGSPITLNATLSALVISTPLKPASGNYGSGSMMILSSPGQQFDEPLNIYVPTQDAGIGDYVLQLNLTSQSFTYSWTVTLKE